MRFLYLAVAVFVFVAFDISHNDGRNLRWINSALETIEHDRLWH